jgi:hypothetical protein
VYKDVTLAKEGVKILPNVIIDFPLRKLNCADYATSKISFYKLLHNDSLNRYKHLK